MKRSMMVERERRAAHQRSKALDDVQTLSAKGAHPSSSSSPLGPIRELFPGDRRLLGTRQESQPEPSSPGASRSTGLAAAVRRLTLSPAAT